jgi:hypothetical protein
MPVDKSIDSKKRSRRGPTLVALDELRHYCVSVRLSSSELAQLDSARATVRMMRGEYLRCAALHRLPPTIPPVNLLAWSQLARASANLNQISHYINGASGTLAGEVDELRQALVIFRLALIGAAFNED